jgi:putative transposase
VLVDTLGLVWGLVITGADLQDRDGAVEVLCRLLATSGLGRWQLIWADSAYGGQLEDWVAQLPTPRKLRLEIVRRCRRLVRDYEAKVFHSEAMVMIAMIALMIRRLA